MSTNNRIKVSDLDYNQIRENLKTFMQGQSQFSDYNFEGSALSTLIDLLAYNTHYNALYTNLAINEMFLDSASKRNSVISIANNFGYIPSSSKCAVAAINLTVTQQNATDETKILPKYSQFTTNIENIAYSFYTLEDYITERNGNSYTFYGVKLYEGTPQTVLFVCTEANQKFMLPNTGIDLSTLKVTVQETGEKPNYELYTQAIDIVDITSSSKVYFIKELEDEYYQIYFGSTGLGLPISIGNVITVEYMISSKELGNGASTFTYDGSGLGGSVSVSTVEASYGGKSVETIEQIKNNVAQSFFNQNRAVTPGDYVSLINKLYPNVKSVSVWGGEDNYPPQYGRVFISIKPLNGPYLTPPEKSYITETLLKSKNVVSVTPVIVDPSYIELDMDTTIYYNKNKTTRSIEELKSAAIEQIKTFRDETLQRYDGVFRMSKFSSAIDSIDQSITSSISKFVAYCEITPRFNIDAEYTLNFVNPIYTEKVPEEAFVSTGFYLDNSTTVYYLDDDGVGNIRIFSLVSGTGEKLIKNKSVGTIDYDKGLIKISGLKIIDLDEANFYFKIKTASYDVISVRNQIVDIPDSRIKVNVIQDVIASGNYQGGTNYTFTKSRS